MDVLRNPRRIPIDQLCFKLSELAAELNFNGDHREIYVRQAIEEIREQDYRVKLWKGEEE
jgi:hypothetical protein